MRRALQYLLEDAGAVCTRAAAWAASRVPGLWVLVALLLLPTYDLFDVEMNLYDAQVNVRHLLNSGRSVAAEPRITVVAIDDAARRAEEQGRLNRMQPLSRAYLAELVDRLALLQPSVIVFDIFFDLPADAAADDAALLAALRRAHQRGIRIVAAARLASLHSANLPVLPVDRYLDSVDGVGHASLAATASDKVIRHGMVALKLLAADEFWMAQAAGLISYLPRAALFDPATDSGNAFWCWSLAAATLVQRDAAALPQLRRLRNDPPFLMDFSQPPEQAYAQRSAADVMAGGADRSEIERAIVLIGAGFEGSTDRHSTPLSAGSMHAGKLKLRSVTEEGMHGVQIQAYALRTLAERLAPHARRQAWPEGALTGALFAAGWLLSLAVHRRARPTRWWLVVAIAAGYLVLCTVAYQGAHVYVPMSRPVTAFALAFGLAAAGSRWWAARSRAAAPLPAPRFVRKRAARAAQQERRAR